MIASIVTFRRCFWPFVQVKSRCKRANNAFASIFLKGKVTFGPGKTTLMRLAGKLPIPHPENGPVKGRRSRVKSVKLCMNGHPSSSILLLKIKPKSVALNPIFPFPSSFHPSFSRAPTSFFPFYNLSPDPKRIIFNH